MALSPEVVREIRERLQRALGDRYDQLRFLHEGGMSVIFTARYKSLDETRVIKVFVEGSGFAEDEMRRFRQEGKIIARLQHANICTVHDSEYNEQENLAYIVMQYVASGSLRDLLRTEAPHPTLGLRIGLQVISALKRVHENDIQHRDIKPENILVNSDGHVYVTDFGIAKVAESEVSTRQGRLLGTPPYMSPERIMGRIVDERSDLFSLGCVLYELFTYTSAFEGTRLEDVLEAQQRRDFAPARARAPHLPEALDRLISDLLEFNPDDRPESAAEVERRLQAIQSQYVLDSDGITISHPARRRSATPLLLIAVGAVAVAGIILIKVFGSSQEITGNGHELANPDSVRIAESLSQAQMVAIDVPMAGELTRPGELVAYTLDAREDQQTQIRMLEMAGNGLSPQISLYELRHGSVGECLAVSMDPDTAIIKLTFAEDGRYAIFCEDGGNDALGRFELLVWESPPEEPPGNGSGSESEGRSEVESVVQLKPFDLDLFVGLAGAARAAQGAKILINGSHQGNAPEALRLSVTEGDTLLVVLQRDYFGLQFTPTSHQVVADPDQPSIELIFEVSTTLPRSR